MRLCMNDMLYSFSYALDCVEKDLLGVCAYHGQRVAYLCIKVGEKLKLSKDELLDLAACAVLHDNALTEYIYEEQANGIDVIADNKKINLGNHCILGERNMKAMPLKTDMTGAILYHHENANGTGPFGKKANEVPISAQLIHIADQIDAKFNLNFCDNEKYNSIKFFINSQKNILFSQECAELFISIFKEETLKILSSENINLILNNTLPRNFRNYGKDEIIGFSNVFAGIIDYKSKFTKLHSIGVAQKAQKMGEYYNYSQENITKLYFAGAFHDIGKLVVDTDILEKPDKLTETEYKQIKNHAYATYEILRNIDGLGSVVWWASLHHEKLNGTGYPFGKKAAQLDKNERLLACLDIYQALTELRPYKKGMNHYKAISILKKMVHDNLIDGTIVKDIDTVFVPKESHV